jgi:invasion protein IalB
MPSPIHRLLAATALAAALAAPAWAQEAGTETDASPDAAAEDAPAAEAPTTDEPADDAPADEPADEPADAEAEAEAGAAEGETDLLVPIPEPELLEIVRESHGDWEVRCLPDESECFLYQLALDGDENPVAEFSLVTLPAGSEAVAGVTVVTPLGTLLPAGLQMQIDGTNAGQYDFTFCTQVGCFARFGLTTESINAMKRGRAATLRVAAVQAPERPIDLRVSLTGFTAGFDALPVVEMPQQ